MIGRKVCKSSEYSLAFKSVSVVYEVINYFLLKWKFSVSYYYYADHKLLNFISELRIKRDLLLTVTESIQLYDCAKASLKIKGDFAEVGVYRGGSAKVIAEIKGKKKLHLFDTFAGLPKIDKRDKYFDTGEYFASIEQVKKLLNKYVNVYFYQGEFPQSVKSLKHISFSFVHLDVDLYRSTKESLNYFYPKMSKGGMILIHDYPSSVGVKKACDEFEMGKNGSILKLSGNQGLVIKL